MGRHLSTYTPKPTRSHSHAKQERTSETICHVGRGGGATWQAARMGTRDAVSSRRTHLPRPVAHGPDHERGEGNLEEYAQEREGERRVDSSLVPTTWGGGWTPSVGNGRCAIALGRGVRWAGICAPLTRTSGTRTSARRSARSRRSRSVGWNRTPHNRPARARATRVGSWSAHAASPSEPQRAHPRVPVVDSLPIDLDHAPPRADPYVVINPPRAARGARHGHRLHCIFVVRLRARAAGRHGVRTGVWRARAEAADNGGSAPCHAARPRRGSR